MIEMIGGAIVCDAPNYNIGNLVLHDFSDAAKNLNRQNKFYFNVIRHGSASVHPSAYPGKGRRLHSKVNLLVDDSQFYEVDVDGQNLHEKHLTYHTHRAHEKSNVIRFVNIANNNCRLGGAQRVGNMTQLRNASGSVYLIQGDQFVARVRPNQTQYKFRGPLKNYFFSGRIRCN